MSATAQGPEAQHLGEIPTSCEVLFVFRHHSCAKDQSYDVAASLSHSGVDSVDPFLMYLGHGYRRNI